MADERERIRDQAIAWHLRLADAGADDWRAFVLWLEESPDHAAAYDDVASGDRLLTDALQPANWSESAMVPVLDDPVVRRRAGWGRRIGAAGAAIAAGAAFLLLPDDGAPAEDPLILQTAPGVRRAARLTDGTRIAMNGDTRLSIDRARTRHVTLERGEAVFDVRHDAKHPFEVHSGGVRLLDAGTKFNVVREGPRLSVQVAEGTVIFRPERERLVLPPGTALSFTDGDARPRVTHVAKADVGGWRRGRLAFSAAPLSAVATALARNLGGEIGIDPSLADVRFTGSLSLAGGSERAVPQLARLVDAGWSRNGYRWTLTAREYGPR